MNRFFLLSLALVLAACGSENAAVQTISGAGATFPYPVYSRWATAYREETGIRLNYQSIGSGGGIAQIRERTVTFGASDAPLSVDELEDDGLVQWPMVMGGIVPIVNLAGIGPGDLVLDGPTLADIYRGDITAWDDPAIAGLNPGLALPADPIAVVHRSDGSGTTFNFTYYLGEVSPAWAQNVGVAKAVEWPVGLGAKGNEGVAGNVRQTAGSIGYVEYAFAIQNDMASADMINAAGRRVAPTAESFAAAATSADWTGTPGYGVILANQQGEAAWPITAATFILMHEQPDDPQAAGRALDFFDWAFVQGDEMALDLHYVPMPDSVAASVRQLWSSRIRAADGTAVYSGTSGE